MIACDCSWGGPCPCRPDKFAYRGGRRNGRSSVRTLPLPHVPRNIALSVTANDLDCSVRFDFECVVPGHGKHYSSVLLSDFSIDSGGRDFVQHMADATVRRMQMEIGQRITGER